MIKQFTQGLSNDQDLEEDYLDWFFLSHFGKAQGYWKKIPLDKLHSIMEFENLRQQSYWDNWIQIINKMFK